MAKQKWNKELQAKIIARAWKDENFRKQLIDNPKKTLATMGIDLPANVDFKVLCDDPTHLHFVLPHTPTNTSELSKKELEELASGGFSTMCWPLGCPSL
jgi:hypothetical protein